MEVLIYISILGVFCLLAELFNARRIILPFILVALLGAFGIITQTSVGDYYSGMLNIDALFLSFAPILIGITFLLILMAMNFYQDKKENISDFSAIMIFILAGALAVVSFGNLAMFFVGIEILSISLYILVGSNKNELKSNEAAFKYFLLGSLSSGILLLGIAFVYAISGSFDLADIAQTISKHSNNLLLQMGVLLILVALLFKASVVPFHFWSPDVYEGSPILTTAQMATIVKVAIFGASFKLFSIAFIPLLFFIAPILSVAAAITMTVGNLSAFKQTNVKRILAFSGISNAGFMLMALLAPTKGFDAILFYTTSYSIASLGVFSIAIALHQSTKNPEISAFNGLAKKQPLIAVMLTISALSMAGIPPLAGFWAKYYLFIDVVNDYLWLVVIAILNSAASIFVYFKFIWAMFTKEEENSKPIEIPKVYIAVLVLCTLLLVLLGLFPNLLGYL